MNLRKDQFFTTCLFLLVAVPLFAQTAYFRNSTNANHWVDGGALAGAAWATTTNYFTVDTNTKYQTILGFGGCFSEMAWDAVSALSAAGRDSVIRALFDTSGLNYTFCRMPIGSNDFADSYYSLDDVSGDYSMTNFSLHRDSTKLIPFIKAAQAYKPNLRFWASPWTPPSWMKNNNNYYNTGTASQNSMKSDAQTLTAYALYLSKAVQEFKKAGINIEYITCQNEPDQIDHNYPTCGWSYALELTFYKTYMIPRFQQDNLATKILLGVYCCTSFADGITSFMNDATVKSWVGVTSHSWQDYSFGTQATSAYPSIPFFETEADWGQNGTHDWNEGVNQFNSMINFLTTGKASVFEQWGIILDQNYSTHWNFKQSGPINVNTNTKAVTYEPHYWAIKHIEHFVKPGAKAIKISASGTNPGKMAAFKNPDGDVIVVCSNTGSGAYQATVKVDDTMWKATFPGNSFNTLQITSGNVAVSPQKGLRNGGMPVLNDARILNSMLYFTIPASIGAQDAQEMNITLTDLRGRAVWSGHCGGAAIHGVRQAFSIRPTQGGLRSGAYLLNVKIKNGADAITTVEEEVTAVN
jgi:glucosylceramidase